MAMSQGDAEIQDSGADSRPQTFGQAWTGDRLQRCRRLAPRTPDGQTLFNAISVHLLHFLMPVAQC